MLTRGRRTIGNFSKYVHCSSVCADADNCVQYVNKYSASFWGTSFVKEMTRLNQFSGAFSSSIPASKETAAVGKNELNLTKEDANGTVVSNVAPGSS